MRAAIALLLAAAACAGSELAECAGDLVCPTGQVCAPAGDRCVLREQIAACAGKAERDGCTYLGFSGACAAGYCLGEGGNAPYTLVVALAGPGAVRSDPAGIDCGARCSAQFPPGTTVALTASTVDNSSFTGWSAPCATAAAVCMVTVTATAQVTATFAPPPPPVISSVTPLDGTGVGQPVTVAGAHLTAARAVTFNGVAQPDFSVVDDGRIATRVPAGATTGPVTVTTPGGQAASRPFPVLLADVTALTVSSPAGCVDVTYTVAQAQGLPVDVRVEIDPGGGAFQPATSAGPPDRERGVEAAPGGTAHIFRWKSNRDLPHAAAATTVRVSATVAGVAGSGGASLVRGGVAIDNRLAFAPATLAAAGMSPVAVAAADLGRDGRIDLAAADRDSADVAYLRGLAAGGFAAPVFRAASPAPAGIALADLDRDGRPDVVVGDGGGTLTVLLAGGGAVSYPTGAAPLEALAVVDLDRDGDLDVAAVGTGDSAWILRGAGDGTLRPAAARAAGVSPAGLAAADLDRDGKPELIVADQAAGAVVVLATEAASFAACAQPRAVAAADVDGDGRLDVLAACEEGVVAVLRGDGGGGLAAPLVRRLGTAPAALAVADLDRDGRPDLAAADPPERAVWVARGNGDGTFAEPVRLAMTGHPRQVIVAELDGDGRPDLVATSEDRNGVAVFRNLTPPPCAPALVPAAAAMAGAGPSALVTADLDRDGRLDLAVSNAGSDDVTVLLGDGHGGFRPGGAYPAGHQPYALAAADLDGDGVLELVSAPLDDGFPGQTAPGALRVLPGRGDGTFGQAVAAPTGTGPLGVAVADLDEDGRPDLAAAGYGAGEISVLLGRGGLELAPPVGYPVGLEPLSIAAGDLDGDGHVDLIAGTQLGRLVVLLGAGDGTFGPPAAYVNNAEATSVALADLDGDGALDVVTCNFRNVGGVSLLLGNGDGTLQPARTFAAGLNSVWVAIEDLDADGRLDVIVANLGDDSVSFLRGDGAGGLAPPIDVPSARAPIGLATGDVDGDGLPDVVVAGSAGGDVGVLLAR